MEFIAIKKRKLVRTLNRLLNMRKREHLRAQRAAGIAPKKQTTVKKYSVVEEVLHLGLQDPRIQRELGNGDAKPT